MSKDFSYHLSKGIIFLFACIVFAYRSAAFNVCIQEGNDPLPAVPVLGDREQIEVLVKSMDLDLPKDFKPSNLLTESTLITGRATIELKNIEIKGDKATVACVVKDCDGVESKDVLLFFEKVGFYWKPIETEFSQVEGEEKPLPSNIKTNKSLTVTSIVFSNHLLISIPHPWASSNTYVINADYTRTNLTKQLFSYDMRTDIDAKYFGNDPVNAVSFHLDPRWQRIIYGKKGNWIRSYGDHTGDYEFIDPQSMAVDVRDTIYVTDAIQGKIVKLYFDNTSGLIQYVSSFNIAGLLHPISIDIDQSGTLSNNPANDHIWVVDDFEGKLVDFHRDGTVHRTIFNYYKSGVTYRLSHPGKLLVMDGIRLGFVDRERMAFVVGSPPSSSSVTTMSSNVVITQFDPATSDLTCVGLDLNNEWWVGDYRQRMYHKFDWYGNYLASYSAANDPPGQFSNPVSITKAPYVLGPPLARSQYIYTSDQWGDQTGMRAFLPGTDALNRSFVSSTGCYSFIRFLLTNRSYVKGTLYEYRNGNYVQIATYNYNMMNAGWQNASIDNFKMGSASYKYVLESLPSYENPDYGPWRAYPAIYFSTTASYFGASIVPVPSSKTCFSNETGTWEVKPECPEPQGFYSYQWYYRLVGGETWSAIGTNNKQLSFYVPSGAKDFELKCNVVNTVPSGYGWETAVYRNCPPPPPPSCPFVFTWDGTQFQEDNNILPQSVYRDSVGKNVIDYYRLMKPLVATNGVYKLQIREDATERSLLDHFKLIAVDHPQPTNIIVSKSGEIIQYITPHGLQNARLNLTDVTSVLSNADSMTVTTANGDSMLLSFGNLNLKDAGLHSSSEGGVVMEASVPCKDCEPPPAMDKVGIGAELLSNSSITTHRLRSSLVYIPFRDVIIQNPKLRFRGKMTVDVANLAVNIQASYQTTEIPLVSATHTEQGDVKSMLTQTDSVYAVLDPGESIELHFSATPVPLGKKRTFILVSTGQYFTIENQRDTSFVPEEPTSEAEVTEFGVSPNYPNPFNPLTKIDFQLPTDGQVKIMVYDIMGREVATLVDQKLSKGTHTFSWDASGVASGMYFCRYFVTDNTGKVVYNEAKKMLLMR